MPSNITSWFMAVVRAGLARPPYELAYKQQRIFHPHNEKRAYGGYTIAYSQIRVLLERDVNMSSRGPAVHLRISELPLAGQGVFARRNICKGEAICLYPGIHTPAIPFGTPCTTIDEDRKTYLNNQYIMNLPTMGGFIDGMNVDKHLKPDATDNPHAVGHLVNHPGEGRKANCSTVDFYWRDVLNSEDMLDVDVPPVPVEAMALSTHAAIPTLISNDTQQVQASTQHTRVKNDLYTLPNVPPIDGTAWYIDERFGEVIYHPRRSSTPSAMVLEGLCGLALVAICDIDEGEELFLDYDLNGPPYPPWATGWYKKSG
eukprot:CFRG1517T1